jgi:FK506-binding nuclear protein
LRVQNYQQTLDIVVAEDERIFFKVTGTHTVHLTGNYVIPTDEGHAPYNDDDSEDDYDLSPDEDELDLIDDEESDDLDGLDDPRITELAFDDDEAPKLVKAASKGKNKRAAADSDDESGSLDAIMAKSLKSTEATTNGEKLSKKQQKKLKKNNGEAAPVAGKSEQAVKDASKSDKKVQFAKNLEQGPTPPSSGKTARTLGVREVQGVEIDDKKLGKGRAAKNGDQISMRYIGKLEDGKVFDGMPMTSRVLLYAYRNMTDNLTANKMGKPFSFKLGKGEVIKGWDIGIAGMTIGGERRITIPSFLAYGKKGVPGIPPNAKLTFDLKLIDIK